MAQPCPATNGSWKSGEKSPGFDPFIPSGDLIRGGAEGIEETRIGRITGSTPAGRFAIGDSWITSSSHSI